MIQLFFLISLLLNLYFFITLKNIEKRKDEAAAAFDSYKEEETFYLKETQRLKDELSKYKEKERLSIDHSLELYKIQQEQQHKSNLEKLEQELNLKKASLDFEISKLKDELTDFQKRQAAINETIRAEQEQQSNFEAHHLLLDKDSISDIEFLVSIKDKIRNPQIIGKLIWAEYLSKPFSDMIKRQFGSRIPKNVIYLIEDKEGRRYIGKTTGSVSDRWTAHLKSSLGIGTIATQKIHKALYNNWTDFSFSILEEVTTSNLSEKEKFYIETFESNIYGYNSLK